MIEEVRKEAKPLTEDELWGESAFWDRVSKTAEVVKKYPAWMRGSLLNERPGSTKRRPVTECECGHSWIAHTNKGCGSIGCPCKCWSPIERDESSLGTPGREKP